MNLPPDKVRLLRSYDNEKKWELICDQVGYDYIISAANLAHCLLLYSVLNCVVFFCRAVFRLCRSASR